jgi:glycosyltransferase involved in cell wall biosynthesis
MEHSYRILMVSTLPLAAPWNLADKNLAATLVRWDRQNRFIVHTSLGEPWPPPPHVTAIRSRWTGEKTTGGQKVLSFLHMLRNTPRADIIHVVSSLQIPTKWVGPLMRTWSTVGRTPIVHTAPSIGDFAIERRNFPGAITVVVSEYTRQRLLNHGISNVFRIYPPLDIDSFRPRTPPKQLAQTLDLGKRAVLYPAHYGDHSGIREMIQAFANLPLELADAVLVFACRAYPWQNPEVEAQKVQLLAQEAGISSRVRVVGTVSDMAALMSACAVTALVPRELASKMDVPYIFLEALALERPVIVSDQPPINEALVGDGGLAVRYGDIPALRQALIRLLSDAGYREQLAKRGYAAVREHCNPTHIVTQYQEFYRLAAELRIRQSNDAEPVDLK